MTQQELMDIRTDDSDVELDLDYGNGYSTSVSPRSQNVDFEMDEFDNTARMELPTEPATRKVSARMQRQKDDLDIL